MGGSLTRTPPYHGYARPLNYLYPVGVDVSATRHPKKRAAKKLSIEPPHEHLRCHPERRACETCEGSFLRQQNLPEIKMNWLLQINKVSPSHPLSRELPLRASLYSSHYSNSKAATPQDPSDACVGCPHKRLRLRMTNMFCRGRRPRRPAPDSLPPRGRETEALYGTKNNHSIHRVNVHGAERDKKRS